jgi:TetR/AcrR family transcriptional regulator, cholesterol catabolism regulator
VRSRAHNSGPSRATRGRKQKIRALVEDPALVTANRRHLVATTTALLRTKGYHNTSTRDIAAAADMSVGAVYQYIQHKEDIMVLILQSVVEIYEERIYPLAAEGRRARERLREAVDRYYRTLDEHHARTNVLYQQFSVLDARTRKSFSLLEDKVHGIMKAILDQGVADGDFAAVNTFLVAHNIVSLGPMWALTRRRFRNVLTIDEYIAEQQRCLDKLLAVA